MTNYQLLPRACVIIPRMSVTPPTRLRGAHQNGRILLFMAGCVLVGALGTGAVLVRLGRFPNLAFGPPTATPTATDIPTLTPSPTPPRHPPPLPHPSRWRALPTPTRSYRLAIGP